jgi:outer membrane immunogenic protein
MKIVALAFAAIFALLTAPALAADMAVKAPPPPPAPPVYDWSGFYLGLEGGGGFGSTTHQNQIFPAANSGGNSNLRGGLAGGTYGYNWQFDHVVLGFEGDISWSGISDTFTSVNGLATFCPSGFPCYTSLQWLGTDRARLGYAFDRVMIYATGGVAYGDVRATILNAGPFGIDTETHLRVGYTVGGGIEAMIAPNWSVKLEYLYTDFGNHVGYAALPPPPPLQPEDVYLNSNIVRAGIDYHFSGPIAAKY